MKSGWLDIDQAVSLACLQTETRLRSIRKQGQFSVFLTRQTWKLNDLYRSERTPFFSYVPTRVDERWRSLTIAKRPESRRFDKNYQCRIHQTTRHVKFEPVQMLSKIDENLSSFDNIPLGFISEKTLSLREQLQVFMFQLSKGKARIWPSGPCSRILSWFPSYEATPRSIFSPLDGMPGHRRGIPSVKFSVPIYTPWWRQTVWE